MSFRIRLTHPAAPLAAAPSHARRGNSRCGAGLVRNLLRGMVCAVLTVQMLTGCARSTPQEPVQWDLSPEAQRTYATLLLDQSIRGDDKEGVLEAVKLLLTLENRPQPFIDAAAWLMLNRETSEARSLLEQAVKRVPGDLGLHLLLAETWLEQGDNEQALKILKEYRKQRPDSELVQQELGILYVKTGHFKDADKVFSALPQRLRTSFVRYAHAQALVGLKQPHRAIQQLRLAVQESPEFVDAWFELARLLEADRQFSEANEIYNSLIEQDPDNPDIWIRMVEGQIRAGKGQKALDYALNGPATYGYKLTAATLFLDARMYPEAEALLDGLKSDPNAPDEVHFYLAAIAYEYHKDVQETLNFLESIPPENRFYDRALRLRIQLLHDQQRYEDAMQLILQGQSQFPTERDFRLMEIHLYLLQDRYRKP
ncbi:MAG: tetratricopeptide repeat protein [Bilophila wadsworthia]